MRITYKLFDGFDGSPLSIPVHAPGRWDLQLSQRGSGKHDLVIPFATAFTQQQWEDATIPWRHVLCEMWDGEPKYAGFIIDKHWSPRRQVLTCDTWTPETLLQDRYPFGVGSYFTTTFGVYGRSLRGAISEVVGRVTSDPFPQPGQSWLLPLDLPYLGETGGYSRDFPNEDWRTAQQIIDFFQKLEDGPDFAFIPKLDARGWLRWDVLVGDPLVPGPTVDLPLSVRTSPAGDVVMHEYGRDMRTGQFVKGEGYDKRRPFGEAGAEPGPAVAVRDVAQNEVREDLDLDSIARARLRRNRSPILQNDIGSLRVGDGPGAIAPSSVRLGARFNSRYSGDGYKSPFTEQLYLTSFSFDSASRPDFVIPELQVI